MLRVLRGRHERHRALPDAVGHEAAFRQALDRQVDVPLAVAEREEEVSRQQRVDAEPAEPSDVVHNDLRARYERGDAAVLAAIEELRGITDRAAQAIAGGKAEELARAIDDNFEVRRRIMNVAAGHLQMVEVARSCGASANFAGSGGAIVGTLGSARFEDLKEALGAIGCRVITPIVS